MLKKISSRRGKIHSKPFSWLFFIVCIVCITPVLAISWNDNIVYDEFNDSIVNWTIWHNQTTGTIFSTSEDTQRIYISGIDNDAGNEGSDKIFSFNSTQLPDFNIIKNVTIKIDIRANVGAGSSPSTRAETSLIVFGNLIKQVKRNDSVTGLETDNSIWSIRRNKTFGDDKYDVFDDGVFQSQINATDNNISIQQFVRDTSTGLIQTDTYFYSLNYSYSNDTINITLNHPEDNYLTATPINFNITTITSINQLQNITLFIDDVLNETKSITGTTNETIFAKSFSIDNYNWTVLVCDNDNNCKGSLTRNINVSNIQVNDESWNNETIEGSLETFIINITTPISGQSLGYGSLIYNGISYIGSITNLGGDNYSLTRNLEIPIVSTDTNYTFYWNIIFEDGSSYNHTEHNQTVKNIGIDDCSVNSILLFNLSHLDEELQTYITAVNTTLEIDIDIYSIGGTSPIVEYYHKYLNKSNPQVCLEDDLSNSTYQLYTEILYEAINYSNEYYYIQNYTLNNDSLPQNINLYDLDDVNAQEFKIIFKDESFLPVADALIQIQRKYISEGVYKTVEIPKTDANGETLAHLRLDDAIYTIIVTRNGETLATFSDVKAICQNPTLDECIIPLNVFGTSLSVEDYTTADDFAFTLTYNTTSRLIQSTFAVPSGAVSTIVINATLYDNLGDTQACSDTLTSSSGTLSCTVPIALGNGTVIIEISKDGNLISTGFISLDQEPEDLYGASIVFLGLFLILTLVGIGVQDNPMVAGVFIILGSILLVAMNLIDTGTGSFIGAGATILWIIIAVILILIKGAKRS